MIKLVSTKKYNELNQQLKGLQSVNAEQSIRISTLDGYVRSLETQNGQCNAKVQAMREEIDIKNTNQKRLGRTIDEMETEIKMLKSKLADKALEVLDLTEKNTAMRSTLKELFKPIAPTEEIPNTTKSVEIVAVEAIKKTKTQVPPIREIQRKKPK